MLFRPSTLELVGDGSEIGSLAARKPDHCGYPQWQLGMGKHTERFEEPEAYKLGNSPLRVLGRILRVSPPSTAKLSERKAPNSKREAFENLDVSVCQSGLGRGHDLGAAPFEDSGHVIRRNLHLFLSKEMKDAEAFELNRMSMNLPM